MGWPACLNTYSYTEDSCYCKFKRHWPNNLFEAVANRKPINLIKLLLLYAPYYSNLDRIICIYFGVFAKWGCIRELQSNLWRGGDKNLFFLYKNLSLLLILFITFKAIDSPERVSSNKQPRYVTVWYCLMCISPYLISRLLTLLSKKGVLKHIMFYVTMLNVIFRVTLFICFMFLFHCWLCSLPYTFIYLFRIS